MKDLRSQLVSLRAVLDHLEEPGSCSAIAQASLIITESLRSGGTVYTCGNGGSAACAMHMTEEMVGKFKGYRDPIPSICLNSDPTVISCIANDFGWAEVFSRQIKAHGKKGDCLVAFSTSGNSQNVTNAMWAARDLGVKSILLTGASAPMYNGEEIAVRVGSDQTARSQEVHTFLLHYFLGRIEEVIDDQPTQESEQ